MKIYCQFLGCNEIIDLDKEFKKFKENLADAKEEKSIKKIPWCFHQFTCPKCGNAIGMIELGPDVMLSLGSSSDASIFDPGKKKEITIKGWKKHKRFGIKKLLNPYLKKWARVK